MLGHRTEVDEFAPTQVEARQAGQMLGHQTSSCHGAMNYAGEDTPIFL
jgi:hypothetical protein